MDNITKTIIRSELESLDQMWEDYNQIQIEFPPDISALLFLKQGSKNLLLAVCPKDRSFRRFSRSINHLWPDKSAKLDIIQVSLTVTNDPWINQETAAIVRSSQLAWKVGSYQKVLDQVDSEYQHLFSAYKAWYMTPDLNVIYDNLKKISHHDFQKWLIYQPAIDSNQSYVDKSLRAFIDCHRQDFTWSGIYPLIKKRIVSKLTNSAGGLKIYTINNLQKYHRSGILSKYLNSAKTNQTRIDKHFDHNTGGIVSSLTAPKIIRDMAMSRFVKGSYLEKISTIVVTESIRLLLLDHLAAIK